MPSLRSLGSAGRLAARVAGARDGAGGSPGAASSGARVHPAPSPAEKQER